MTEETLGRRIAAHRKKLGLTQDGLAEKLGITAQAVSKWENDQSCPDIAMLPKLAQIFGTTVDSLLGVQALSPQAPEDAQYPPETQEPPNALPQAKPGRKTVSGFAVWLLLSGLLLLVGTFLQPSRFLIWRPPFWEVLGLTGVVVFGLFGLYPRFSLLRLGCAAAGGYYLYCSLFQPVVRINQEILGALLLVFLGAGLLLDSVRGKRPSHVYFSTDATATNHFECTDHTFVCSTCFGEEQRVVTLPVLEGGEGNVVFGSLSVDLRACGCVGDAAAVQLKCCFGTLTLLVPHSWKITCINKTVFGEVREAGRSDAAGENTLLVENHVCFGEIQIKYI